MLVDLNTIGIKVKIKNNIIQCYTRDSSFLSDEERSAMKRLREMNPDWNFFFYDISTMRDFVKENYPKRYLNAFDQINPDYGAAVSDYFRYLVIYKLGGVYLDNKAFTTMPLSEIVKPEDEMVVFSWRGNPRSLYLTYGIHKEIRRGDEFQQWNIISVEGSRYIAAVIEAVTLNIENYSVFKHGTGYGGILRTTGPIAYTNAIDDIYDGSGIRFAGNNEANGIMYRDDISFPTRNLSFHYSHNNSPVIMMNPLLHHTYTYAFSLLRACKRKLKGH